MNHGIYIAAAGMKSRLHALEVGSNNVANAGTLGYKKDRVFYNIFNRVAGSPVETALAESVVSEQTRTLFEPGPRIRTDNPLDLALGEEGFFAVGTPAGVRFTRNGRFTLNSQRELVTSEGFRVLGRRGPIRLPEGQVSVGETGEVSVGSIVAGRLRVSHFDDLNQLRKSGQSFFEALPGAGERLPQNLSVQQGVVERSNVNPVEGLADMIHNMRSFQMLARSMRSLSEVNRRVIDEVGRM